MSIGRIGETPAYRVAAIIEHNALKKGQQAFTTIKNGRYTVRVDNNDGTYVKTCLDMDKHGTVEKAFSTLMRNSKKLKQKIADFLRA